MRKDPDGSSESDALQAYLRAIARIPRLTVEEERELGRRIRQDHDRSVRRWSKQSALRRPSPSGTAARRLFSRFIHEGQSRVRKGAPGSIERNVKFIT